MRHLREEIGQKKFDLIIVVEFYLGVGQGFVKALMKIDLLFLGRISEP